MPDKRITFLNALAFGIVAPLLYFMIALPDVQWIARLLVVDSLGRICGKPIAKKLNLKPGSLELLNVLGYALLAIVGCLQPAQTAGFAMIYASRFLGAFASANLPAVRLISQNPPGISIAQTGFAIGCAITAVIGNHHFLPASILLTHGLMVPGILAAAVSATSAILVPEERSEKKGDGELFHAGTEEKKVPVPFFSSEQCPSGATAAQGFSLWIAANAAWILLACEAAYGMIFCVLPLTTREICAFSPMTTAIYFACFALLSVATAAITRRISAGITLCTGLIFSAIGFAGISIALGLSWQYANPNRELHGTIAAWIAGAIGAIGHGLLSASLPSVERKLPIKLNWISPLVAAIGALIVCRLWVAHERSAFAIPAAIMMSALPCIPVMLLVPRKEPRGFLVVQK